MELASLVVVERAYEATFCAALAPTPPSRRPVPADRAAADPADRHPQAGLDVRPLLCHAVMLRLGYGHLFCLPA